MSAQGTVGSGSGVVWSSLNCNLQGLYGAVRGNVTDALCIQVRRDECEAINHIGHGSTYEKREDCDRIPFCLFRDGKCKWNRDRRNNVCVPAQEDGSPANINPICHDITRGVCPEKWQVKRGCCTGESAKYVDTLQARNGFVCCNMPCAALQNSTTEQPNVCTWSQHKHCQQCGPSGRSIFGPQMHSLDVAMPPKAVEAVFGMNPGKAMSYGINSPGFGFMGMPGPMGVTALEEMGVGRSKNDHVDEITVDDLFDTLIAAIDNDKDMFEFNRELNSDPWFGKQMFGGRTDGYNFVNPWKFIDQIYGSPFGLSQARMNYGTLYGFKSNQFKDPYHKGGNMYGGMGSGPMGYQGGMYGMGHNQMGYNGYDPYSQRYNPMQQSRHSMYPQQNSMYPQQMHSQAGHSMRAQHFPQARQAPPTRMQTPQSEHQNLQQPSIQQSHQQGQINNQQTNFHQNVLQPEAQPPHSFSSPQDYQNSYQSNSYSADHNSYSPQSDRNSYQSNSYSADHNSYSSQPDRNSYQSNSYSADHNSYSSQPDLNSYQASSPGVLTSGNDYGLDNLGSPSQTYQGGFSDQYGFDQAQSGQDQMGYSQPSYLNLDREGQMGNEAPGMMPNSFNSQSFQQFDHNASPSPSKFETQLGGGEQSRADYLNPITDNSYFEELLGGIGDHSDEIYTEYQKRRK